MSKLMDETIEKIVNQAKAAVRGYCGDDQYMIYEEVARRLQEEGHEALMLEYMGAVDDEQ